MDYKLEKIEKYNDKRGKLVVFLKNNDLGKNYKKFGQIYFITFDRKGVIRGNHYHKEWREWFGVVEGKLQVELEDIKTKEHISLVLNSEDKNYIRLEIGPYIVHSFKSLTKHASLLNYADKEWFPNDTFLYKLM